LEVVPELLFGNDAHSRTGCHFSLNPRIHFGKFYILKFGSRILTALLGHGSFGVTTVAHVVSHLLTFEESVEVLILSGFVARHMDIDQPQVELTRGRNDGKRSARV
jgi:hypothetical protein